MHGSLRPRSSVATYPTDWLSWASQVLQGINAPATAQNYETLWKWTSWEKGIPSGGDPVQWNNPLNTTQPDNATASENSAGVRAYPDIATGASDTVETLTNGLYGDILAGLRASTPPQSWSDAARQQLGEWGTGTAWIDTVQNLGGNGQSLTPDTGGSGSGGTMPTAPPQPTPSVSPTSSNPLDGISGAFNTFFTWIQQWTMRIAVSIVGILLIAVGVALLMQSTKTVQTAEKVAAL